eukprot:TRINITY_DN23638_c0_g1_i1.p1 TRINITY_DN23638_c0_g1~~TRINITY_DN23638_c0_g1_i1.p1  ORF type:complete len:158 (+),score=10.58 TRINITY_DN23638_c0_g1_i1:30-476(+)
MPWLYQNMGHFTSQLSFVKSSYSHNPPHICFYTGIAMAGQEDACTKADADRKSSPNIHTSTYVVLLSQKCPQDSPAANCKMSCFYSGSIFFLLYKVRHGTECSGRGTVWYARACFAVQHAPGTGAFEKDKKIRQRAEATFEGAGKKSA